MQNKTDVTINKYVISDMGFPTANREYVHILQPYSNNI